MSPSVADVGARDGGSADADDDGDSVPPAPLRVPVVADADVHRLMLNVMQVLEEATTEHANNGATVFDRVDLIVDAAYVWPAACYTLAAVVRRNHVVLPQVDNELLKTCVDLAVLWRDDLAGLMPLHALTDVDALPSQRLRPLGMRTLLSAIVERSGELMPMLASMQNLLSYVQASGRGAVQYMCCLLQIVDNCLQVSAARTSSLLQALRRVLPIEVLLSLLGNRGMVEYRRLILLLLRLTTRVRAPRRCTRMCTRARGRACS